MAFLSTWFGIRVSTEYQIIGDFIDVIVLGVSSVFIIFNAETSNSLYVFTVKFLPKLSVRCLSMLLQLREYFNIPYQ